MVEHGPDPLFNAKLASLITTAKKSGLAKMSIETAIARGQGASLNGDALEGVTFEVMMKPAVAFIIECQTDNKARTTQEIRDVFKEFKATATPTTYMFEKKGRVILEKLQAVNDERILEQALEAGALDVISEENGKSVTIMTDPIDTTTVAKSMTAALPLEVESLDIIWEAREDMKASIDSTDESERIESFISMSILLVVALFHCRSRTKMTKIVYKITLLSKLYISTQIQFAESEFDRKAISDIMKDQFRFCH